MSTSDSPENVGRDLQLGAALRAISEPPTPDGFWDDLSQNLAALDGETHQPNQQRNNVTSLDSWRQIGSRLLMVAAVAAMALVGGLALANPFGDDDATAVQASDDDETGDDLADDSTDTDADTDTDDGSTTTDDSENGAVDYTGQYRVSNLPAGAAVAGADHFVDSLLLTTPIADSEGSGCEGAGRVGLSTQTADGTVLTPASELPDIDYVVQNNQNRLVLGNRCEEFTTLNWIAGLQGQGEIQIENDIETALEGVDAFTGRPLWSADGERLLVNGIEFDGGFLLFTIDANTGELVGQESIDRLLLAELAGGVAVNQTDEGIEVNGVEIPLIDDQDFLFVQTAVSLDQTMVAAWSGNNLVIVNSDGMVLGEMRDEDEVGDAAWNTSGQLLSVSTIDPDIIVWSPGRPVEPVVVDVELGTEGWSSVAVADDGRVVAVSTFDGSASIGYALTFDPTIADPTSDDDTTGSDGSGSDGATGDSDATATTLTTQPEAAAEQPESEIPLGGVPLSLNRIGPIEIGMTVVEAGRALGDPEALIVDINPDISAECGYAVLRDDVNSPRFMVIAPPDTDPREGVIARIELVEGLTTIGGIGIGDSVEEMRAAYDGELDFMAEESSGGVYVYGPTDFNEGTQYRIVFEAINDEIVSIRSGRFPEVGYIEGCL